MKPITEDQVVALLDGLAEREKDAARCRALEATDGTLERRTATGRILRLAQKADVVSLSAHRQSTSARRAVSGFFFYVSGKGASV